MGHALYAAYHRDIVKAPPNAHHPPASRCSTGATGSLAVRGLNTPQTRKVSYQSPQLLLVCQPACGHIACNEYADLFPIYPRMLNRLADCFRCHITTANTGVFW